MYVKEGNVFFDLNGNSIVGGNLAASLVAQQTERIWAKVKGLGEAYDNIGVLSYNFKTKKTHTTEKFTLLSADLQLKIIKEVDALVRAASVIYTSP
jgi:hypothetical protein